VTAARARLEPNVATGRCVSRIAAHLARLAEGHDPMGHLFAVERLARAARAEWWEAHREGAPERRPR